jgi:hypothetical protein
MEVKRRPRPKGEERSKTCSNKNGSLRAEGKRLLDISLSYSSILYPVYNSQFCRTYFRKVIKKQEDNMF